MFILKTTDKYYIVRGPEKAKHRGRCCVSPDRSDALQFATVDAAMQYSAFIKATQKAQGFKAYEITSAFVCNA